MRHEIHAEVLEDSTWTSRPDIRITTLEVTFPRFILAEFNTHRQFSRNSASSRAIPPEKLLEQVEQHPFVPVFGTRVKGMGQGENLDPKRQELAQDLWLVARDKAVNSARALAALNADKSHVNRLLEPFMWHTVIVTSRYWEHFFGLRIDDAAQAEFRQLATAMHTAITKSTPAQLTDTDWHLPMVTHQERETWPIKEARDISAGRCARVSFDTHMRVEEPDKSIARARERLLPKGHLSPTEHQAGLAWHEDGVPITYIDGVEIGGNLGEGVMQYRKLLRYEDRFDILKGDPYALHV